MRRLLPLLFVAGCSAGAPERPLAPSAAGPLAPAPAFVPRLVRQGQSGYHRVEVGVVGGGRRAVRSWDDRVVVAEPEGGAVWDSERLVGAQGGELDPSFRYLCVSVRSGDGWEVARLDLHTRKEQWRSPVPEPIVRVLGLPDGCGVLTGPYASRALYRYDASGRRAPNPVPGPAPAAAGVGRHVVVWSADRGTFFDAEPQTTPGHPQKTGFRVDVRDGATLQQRAAFWAGCLDVGPRNLVVGRHPEERRDPAALALPGVAWADCAAPSPERGGRAGTAAWVDLVLTPERRVDGRRALPRPWVPMGDGRLARHDADGLFFVDPAASKPPLRVSSQPVVSYVDVNGQDRAVEPVVSPGAPGWVGVVTPDGQLARYDLAGKPLPAVALPRDDVGKTEGDFQVFAGPGGPADARLLVLRDVGDGRVLHVGDASGRFVASPAKVFLDIWQDAWFEPEQGAWLLVDPHHGLSVVDASSGRVRATFSIPDTWSRVRAARAPDGATVFVVVEPAEGDTAGGLYWLDPRKLTVTRRLPYPAQGPRHPLLDWRFLSWDAGGIELGEQGLCPMRLALDPSSGAIREAGPARGEPREAWGFRAGPPRVSRTPEDLALLEPRLGESTRFVGMVSGHLFVEEPDGRVYCEGAACERYRCRADAATLAPYGHPACAGLRR